MKTNPRGSRNRFRLNVAHRSLGVLLKGLCIATVSLVGLGGNGFLWGSELANAVKVLQQVGPEGVGNREAKHAWKTVQTAAPSDLPFLLSSLDASNELASNWIRAAIDTVVGRSLTAKIPLPLEELGSFVADASHSGRGRALAFDVIRRTRTDLADRLLPVFLNDPAPELRREAVSKWIEDGKILIANADKAGASLVLHQALGAARDADQIESISKALKDLGRKVDLPQIFGFLTEWQIVGPFDSAQGKGFEKVYAPENGVDLKAAYPGKESQVTWRSYRSVDEMGMVDFNKAIGLMKGVAGYAFTEFNSSADRSVDLRLGCKNAWKIWINGKYLFGRDEYHRGMEIDQYRIPIQLKAGRNTILVKLCQDEQKEEWTVEWQFQMRLCDTSGAPVRSVKVVTN